MQSTSYPLLQHSPSVVTCLQATSSDNTDDGGTAYFIGTNGYYGLPDWGPPGVGLFTYTKTNRLQRRPVQFPEAPDGVYLPLDTLRWPTATCVLQVYAPHLHICLSMGTHVSTLVSFFVPGLVMTKSSTCPTVPHPHRRFLFQVVFSNAVSLCLSWAGFLHAGSVVSVWMNR